MRPPARKCGRPVSALNLKKFDFIPGNDILISAVGGRMGYICPNISPIQSIAASLDAVPDRLPGKYSDLRFLWKLDHQRFLTPRGLSTLAQTFYPFTRIWSVSVGLVSDFYPGLCKELFPQFC